MITYLNECENNEIDWDMQKHEYISECITKAINWGYVLRIVKNNTIKKK